MKVLHLLPTHLFAIGGMEDFTRNLALRLQRHGIDVEIWHLPLRKGALLMDDPPSLKVDDLPVKNLSRYRVPCFDPRRLRRYDLVHVHGVGGIADMVALSSPWHRRPLVVSTHGGIFHTTSMQRIKRLYFDVVEPLVARWVTCYVACSVNDHDLFAGRVPHLELIENGVEVYPRPVDPKDPGRWVWIGRWSRNKELPALFAAVAAARRLMPAAKLEVVGAPDDLTRDDLKRLALESGLGDGLTIHQAVPRARLAEILAGAGLTLSAARHEGFGLAVIEAMSAGCVPVVNDIPVFRRFVAQAGVGRVCSYADPQAAGTAMVEVARAIADDPRTAERASGFARRYAWPEVEGRWLALYRRLVKAGHHE
jgi:alpha-1,3-mannosyltransferase